MTFHVGQKVVCVDDSPAPPGSMPWKIIGDLNGLTKARVYTIRRAGLVAGRQQVWVSEIVRPLLGSISAKYGEMGYRPSRFRPLTDQKKSVSFTQGAPLDSERWDNRRKIVEPVNALINASNAVSDRFDRRAVQVQNGVGR